MSRRSVLLISILIILAVGGLVGYKMWNKPFKDPLEGEAIKVTAVQLFNDFSTNEIAAQKKYVPEKLGNKKVEVTGVISEIGKNNDGETFYTLKTTDEMFGVKCIMDKGEETANAGTGDTVTVRGFCDGYNMDVIVNRCKIVK
jgi:multidrug efflux pump subunit AcrB